MRTRTGMDAWGDEASGGRARPIRSRGPGVVVIALLVLALGACDRIYVARVSVSSTGAQADADVGSSFAVSGDGRYVAFQSTATNLVPDDTNGTSDVFVRDNRTGAVERVSVTSTGAQSPTTPFGNTSPSISADGRWVAFVGWGPLAPGVPVGTTQVYVRDRITGTTEVVSVDRFGNPAGFVSKPVISGDGRYVAYTSYAGTIVEGIGGTHVYLRDRQGGTVWVPTTDGVSSGGIVDAVSGDGRYVLFRAASANLVAGDTNGTWDVFRYDRVTGTVARASVATGGGQGNGSSGSSDPAEMSSNGRYVVFSSAATNLVAGDTNGVRDVFRRDLTAGTTTRVNLTAAGEQEIASTPSSPSISDDGRWVAFVQNAAAGNVLPGPCRVVLRDGDSGRVACAATNASGSPDGQPPAGAGPATISADGRYVVFRTNHPSLVPDDTCCFDLFVQSVPVPRVTGRTPTSVARGAPTVVIVTGANLLPGVTLDFGDGVAVTLTARVSDHEVRALITVGGGVEPGKRTVKVALPGTGPGVDAGASTSFELTVT